MAEQTPSKRQREETQSSEEEAKRYKSYDHILSLLDAEEDEPSQDLSSIITSLQQELSSSDSVLDESTLPCPTTTTNLEADQDNNSTTRAAANTAALEDDTSATSSLKEDKEHDDKERVIRHLREASDDELGIPNREEVVVEYEEDVFNNVGNGFAACDGLWELEDEAFNYCTMWQSELFM